ncbi:hypothetical protein BCR37DRAFT_393062 [Protomyces lactucae-debilis]|uniref:Uncharacterized protein n=1 Tax=Protomyces lactucae-debilis TaxID=2754530 RepID=A0A1Y2FDM7_PROLT|nr:uncharacterized protein BCR37DRAFT_393062 [Protomyces lactucae-debilis]ORY82019.1 hypothetical protein BCR37DRAFT_393062 [Protomyces lactucae-debilis]
MVLIAAVAADQIHGKEVSAGCVKAYQDAFEPELNRTSKYMALIKLVTTPPELVARATKAGEALQAYQTALKKVDADLAAPVSETDRQTLHETQRATEDVAPVLRELSNSTDEAVRTALKDFREARIIELKANAAVDAACPQDVE